MKMTLQQGWQRLRGGALLPGRLGVLRRANYLRHGLANLVFPPSCLSCDVELDSDDPFVGDVLICEACWERSELVAGPECMRCGAPVPLAEPIEAEGAVRRARAAGCYRCRGRKMWFDQTVALGLYKGRLRELLLRMKRAEGDALSLAMGKLLWHVRGEKLTALGADVIAPIPLHWRRRVVHRTNSAAVLAEVLSSKLLVPLAEGLLRRKRYTVRQTELTPPKRWENVRQAFALGAGYHLRAAHVLLVDDILTTGATCSDAARSLRSAGASRVTVVVAARSLG